MFTESEDPNIVKVILKDIEGLTAVLEHESNGQICRIPVRYIPGESKVGDNLYIKISQTPVPDEEYEAIARKLLEKLINVEQPVR
jgi:hypothetical protein